MKVRLFAQAVPHGRCLILAQKLSHTATLPPAECVELAERLFAFAHRRENPAWIEVPEPQSTTDLAATCAEFGISVETGGSETGQQPNDEFFAGTVKIGS